MIDRATIQRVMDATDIVDVVSEFVTLKKAGANYKGLCPFHNERTPSFSISPARQMYKCFSCGKGGNAVHFLMELEHMAYPEAIKWLGRKYGIEIKEKELTNEEKLQQNERESMFALNEWACKYFEKTLHDTVDGVAIGMAYYRSRGFRDDIIRKFSLGYSLEQRDALAQAALSHGFKKEYLLKTGLCFETEDKQIFDRYRGRVIFPVHSVSGRVVAFGGRVLNTEKQKNVGKYVNSPESDIYSKSHELYGLYQAKSAIVKHERCFLVEGYTDVISMHQSGIENVVASSGTSLTEGQIRLLHRFTNNITVLYDGDAAGIKASLRGIDMLLAEGLNIKVLLLPDGDDPDSFARKHKAEEFQKYIDTHQVDFIKFKIDLLMSDAQSDPLKRAELVTNVVKSISVIPNEVVRQMYIHECATSLSVSEELIVNEINKQHRAKLQAERKKNEGNATDDAQAADEAAAMAADEERMQQLMLGETELAEERMLVALIVRYGDMPMDVVDAAEDVAEADAEKAANQTEVSNAALQQISVAHYIDTDLQADGLTLHNAVYKQVLSEALAHVDEQGWKALPYFLNHPDPRISKLAADVGQDDFVLSSKQRDLYIEEQYRLDNVVPRILHDYKHAIVKEQLKHLLTELRNPQLMNAPEKAKQLMRQYMEISQIERELAKLLGDRVVLK